MKTLRTVTIPASDVYQPLEGRFTLTRQDIIRGASEHQGKFTLTIERDAADLPLAEPLRRFRLALNHSDLGPEERFAASVSMGSHMLLLIELPAIT